MLMDQVIKKERGSSLPATSREHFSWILHHPFQTLRQKTTWPKTTNHKDGFHQFHPPKKTFGSILLSTPPVENIRKLSLWKKHAGFFTASGCFPPSPGPKKTPSSQTMGLVRVWVVDGYFQSSSWVPGRKSAKGWKNSMATLENTRPRSVFFYCKISNIDHFSWIQMNHMNRNNWLWHHAVHGTAKQNTSFKNNLLPSFSFPVTWTKKRVAPL